MSYGSEARTQIVVFWIVLAFFLLGLGLQCWSSPPDPGIVPFELAFNQDRAQEILKIWDEAGVEQARQNLKLDFLFIAGYVALFLVGIWLTLRRERKWLYKFAPGLLAAPAIAGLLDVVENFQLLGIIKAFTEARSRGVPLEGSISAQAVAVAGWAAAIKFALLIITTLVVVVFAQRTGSEGSGGSLDRQFRSFVRRARDASHEALFYLGLMHRTSKDSQTDTIEEYSRFAIQEVRGLHRRAVVPPGLTEAASSVLSDAPNLRYGEILEAWSDLGEWIERAQHQEMDPGHEGEGEGEEPFYLGPTFDTTAKIRRKFKAFLQTSLAQFWWERVAVHWLSDLLSLVRKRLAFLLAAALVYFVATIEAVQSLLLNQPFWTALSVIWLLLPTAFWATVLARCRKRETIPSWDVGGRPFRSILFAATEPGKLALRFPRAIAAEPDSGFGAKIRHATGVDRVEGMLRLIAFGQLVRFGVFLAWWLLGLVLAYLSFVKGAEIVDSRLTGYLICSVLFALLMMARTIDFWEFLDPAPVRLLLVAVTLALGIGMFQGLGRLFWIPFFIAAIGYGLWFLKDRSRVLRAIFAVMFLIFGNLVIVGNFTQERAEWIEDPPADETLPPQTEAESKADTKGEPLARLSETQWPHGSSDDGPVVVLAASGGGSRAALLAALTLQQLHIDNKPIAKGLQAISSVSGGSLANAAYVARRLRERDEDKLRVELEKIDVAVSQDFILPTLWGFLAPGINRGDAIEMSWQGFERQNWQHYLRMERFPCGEEPDRETEATSVALANECLGDVAKAWEQGLEEELPRLPIPLFNTTTLDGHDVVISPLEKSLYTRRDLHKGRNDDDDSARKPIPPHIDDPEAIRQSGNLTWVHDRDGIYGLEDLLPQFNPPLSAAVRASANFPFGFPLVRVRTDRPLFFSPVDEHQGEAMKDVYLTDGGALSNSGMFSLFNLLMNRREALVDRGVLLIIVDASKMPEYPPGGKGVLLKGTIEDQSPVGQYLHRRMFDLLAEAYGPMLAVSQVDLIPEEDRNVLTTWALSRKKREELIVQFLGPSKLAKTAPCADDEASRWCHDSREMKRKFERLIEAAETRRAALERWSALGSAERDLLLARAACLAGLGDKADGWRSMDASGRRQQLEAAGCEAAYAELRDLLTPMEEQMLIAAHSRFERLAGELARKYAEDLIEQIRPPLD